MTATKRPIAVPVNIEKYHFEILKSLINIAGTKEIAKIQSTAYAK